MLWFGVAVMVVILILSTPFRVGSHTLMQLAEGYAVANLKVGALPQIALGIKLSDEGSFVLDRGKAKKKIARDLNKKFDSAPILKQVKLKSLNVRGAVGIESSAAATAMLTQAIVLIFGLINNTVCQKPAENAINILPRYGKDVCELDIKIALSLTPALILYGILHNLIRGKEKSDD